MTGRMASGHSRPNWLTLLRSLVRKPAGLFGLLIVAALLIAALGADWIAPYGEAQQDIAHRLQAPSSHHVLGTDHLGRDVLSRLVYGTRVALGAAVPSVLGAALIGLVLGMVAGYFGGWVDNVILVVMDTIQSYPTVILALALLALLGPSLQNVIVVIVVGFTPGYARVVRAQVLAIKHSPFVEVERALGASDLRLTLIHILPNILAPLLILLAMDLPSAITTEAGLSFLGLGVRPPTPSWGVTLSEGFAKLRTSPWPVVFAGLALGSTTLGFTLFSETLRDLLDPKLAGTRRA